LDGKIWIVTAETIAPLLYTPITEKVIPSVMRIALKKKMKRAS